MTMMPPKEEKKMCKVCHIYFFERDGGFHRTHGGSYAGFEKGKLYGQATKDVEGPLIVYQWDCCGSTDPNAPGCTWEPHVSF